MRLGAELARSASNIKDRTELNESSDTPESAREKRLSRSFLKKDNNVSQMEEEKQGEIEEEEDRTWEMRECLPAERDPNNKPSIWKVLKDLIGKDLSRFAMPVYFNEPISMI